MSTFKPTSSQPVLVIAGPTATGKTSAAVHLACLHGARLVSADAMQVYRGMDIGTGKAHPAVLKNYPHACIDIRDPDEPFSAQDFARIADREVAGVGPTLLVGGTIFYIRAFLYGLVHTPPANPALRRELERLEDPWRALKEVDPALAARLHPNDRVRILRGLEVFRQCGVPLSALHAADKARLRHEATVVWLDRDDLRQRIDHRVDRMMERGYLDEVRSLLDAGYGPHLKPMQSLGYRHLAEHLLQGTDLEEAVRLTKRDTWRFARKQRAWARRQPGWKRLEASNREALLQLARDLWENFV